MTRPDDPARSRSAHELPEGPISDELHVSRAHRLVQDGPADEKLAVGRTFLPVRCRGTELERVKCRSQATSVTPG